ncbi:Mobile element protein [Candidatus Enterovibrio escicola]|uniref:Mobile element protein n=1 Tax=Candidatus Enterovibrio escicola TaxID=1927127 RepID=A0A2A5T032_9GAMM|nr:Mobile element protein [Candidatus Enterovibrio escacola]
MLNPLRRKIQQVSADGAYGARACYHVLKNKEIRPTILSRSNTGTGRKGILEMKLYKALNEDKMAEWKKDRGYNERSLAEIEIFR